MEYGKDEKKRILLKFLNEITFLYRWKYKIVCRWESVQMQKQLAEEYQF